MTYTLHRRLPDGTERTQGPFKSRRDCGKAAFYVLYDNLRLTKKDATSPAFQVETSPLGTEVSAYGYTFRIEQEA